MMPYPLPEFEDHIDQIVQLIDKKDISLAQKDFTYRKVVFNLDLAWKWIRRNYVRRAEDEFMSTEEMPLPNDVEPMER